jgi:2-amino-4-hydroxy-6-hydroxymethyldihydropteridine diphosphokinase
MIRRLKSNYRLYRGSNFPYCFQKRSRYPYDVLLGVGGNIGDVRRRFNHLFIYLQRSRFIEIIETAPILKNPPFGYLDQDDFYNSLIYVKTCLKPKALLRYILSVEDRFGRKRLFQDAPRTLDIDIIFYEEVMMKSKQLILPHYGWRQRDSVLLPLSMMKSAYPREQYAKR